MGYNSTENAIPIMTSNTAPSGIASASSEYSTTDNTSGTHAYRAMNRNTTTYFATKDTTSGWLAYDFSSSIMIGLYKLTPGPSAVITGMPKSWTFEGSNDGANWVVLDTRSNITAWTVNIANEYRVAIPAMYKKYRINVVSNNGLARVAIGMFEMFEYYYDHKFLISSEDTVASVVSEYKSEETSVPKMTTDTSPSGRAFAENVYSASYAPWSAFNRIDDAEGYVSANGSGGKGYLGYEFSNSISIFKYTVRSTGSAYLNRMPKDWTFEGSNDGSNWAVLDTQINQTWTTQYTDKEYLLDTRFHYIKFKMYRINWTANNGFVNFTDVNELKMFEIIKAKYIQIPIISEKMFDEYGMSKNTEIHLNNDVTSISNINIYGENLGLGKVFKQKIDTNKIQIKKASVT